MSNVGSSLRWLTLGSNFTWNDILVAIGILLLLVIPLQLIKPNEMDK
jgi:hypothetical protein